MAAPLPTPSGVIHTRFLHNLNTPTALKGAAFDVEYTGGPPGSTDLLTIASQMRTQYGNHLASLFSDQWLMAQTECTDLAHPSTVGGLDSTSVAGTRTGTAPPLNVTACLIFNPDRRYRGSRPKMFAPWGIDGDLQTSQDWRTSFKTEVDTHWADFITAMSGFTAGTTTIGSQVSVSYITGPYVFVPSGVPGRGRIVGTARVPPLVLGLLSVELSLRIGSQRRRLRTA